MQGLGALLKLEQFVGRKSSTQQAWCREVKITAVNPQTGPYADRSQTLFNSMYDNFLQNEQCDFTTQVHSTPARDG